MARHISTCSTVSQVFCDILTYCVVTGLLFVSFIYGKPMEHGFFCGDTSINFPRVPSIVPFLYLVAIAVGVPVASIFVLEFYGCVMYARRKDGRAKEYILTALKLIGMFMYGLSLTMLISEALKLSVGRLRPTFLNTCRPNTTLYNCSSDQTYIPHVECTGGDDVQFWEIVESRKSFPSGHAVIALYAATFMVLYIEHRVVISFSVFLKSILQASCMLLGMFCAASRVADYNHHISDVIVGALLGISVAIWTVFGLAKHVRRESLIHSEYGGEPSAPLIKGGDGTADRPAKNCTSDVTEMAM